MLGSWYAYFKTKRCTLAYHIMSSTKAPGIYAYPLTGSDHHRQERKTDMAGENGDKRIDESAELSIDQLENVNGGYIMVTDGISSPYNVIDENGVSRMNTNDIKQARRRCAELGLSDQKITRDEYAQIFGHRFHY